ncbi:type II toxin-antitoxin system RelE/ParE family toxin [Candidatus Micrarchaeota archaeon]|nr:type II toxin-antitoxin system RelE/ParE family toxin [Candidatus Micrarchaeota archaeon]
MYSVVFTKKGETDFDSLDSKIKTRVVGVLGRIVHNPRAYLRKLAGTDFYRLGVRDYRIIIHIEKKLNNLAVVKIGHRKNIYTL